MANAFEQGTNFLKTHAREVVLSVSLGVAAGGTAGVAVGVARYIDHDNQYNAVVAGAEYKPEQEKELKKQETEDVEIALFSSLFIVAGTSVAGVAYIKGIKPESALPKRDNVIDFPKR